eukprot:jgi/Tetstr1/444367/TSEL_032258.t1
MPGVNKWRLILDLRPLNRYNEERSLSFETLTGLRHMARPGEYMLSMDLHDGLYAVGIAPEDRDYFTVNYRGKLYRLAGLPMLGNGRSIYKPVETAYIMHVDSSGYGWGAGLNETTKAREFRCDGDREMHITYEELRFILDSNDISIRARYIKTPANIYWADRLSRKIDYDDWAFSLRHFNHLDNIWGRHIIDRFATMENARLPRYNSR